MRYVPKALFLFLSLWCFTCVDAQTKEKTTKTKSVSTTKKETASQPKTTKEEIPPGDVEKIDVDTSDAPPPPPPYIPEVPKINFDTSAAPEDDLTQSIRKLLEVTKSRELDMQLLEKSLKESLATSLENPNTSAMMQKFYDRFVFEMREGRAARWLENIYIRNYRAIFTPAEIQALIDFYQTSAGQKALEKTKILLQNVMGEAQKMGGYLGADLMNKILSEENKR
jgi:hypothetical protein